MAMVVGNEEYDWQALELNCEYKNGYTASDETVFRFVNKQFNQVQSLTPLYR